MSRHSRKKKFVRCAGCIVYRLTPDSIDVLLIKPRADSDAWGIPKGHKEPDEDLIDCAIRETWEETGLACMPEQALDPVDTVNPREYKRLHAFLARHMGDERPDPVMKQEVDDIQWWPIDSLPRLHRYQISLLDQACEMLVAMTLHVE